MTDLCTVVQTEAREIEKTGGIVFPPNYCVENAVRAAWFKLNQPIESGQNKGKTLVEICTPESVKESILHMLSLGLNPAKDQCYFMPYGRRCACQISYFGTMHLTLEMAGVLEINAQVVRAGDDFEISIENGVEKVLKHRPTLKSLDGEIIAAYCILTFPARTVTKILTIAQIQKRWAKSPLYKKDQKWGTHYEFPEEMAKRTIINYACKPYLKSSSDKHLQAEALSSAMMADAGNQLEEIQAQPLQELEEAPINAEAEEFEVLPDESPTPDATPDDTAELARRKKRIFALAREKNAEAIMREEISKIGKKSSKDLSLDETNGLIQVLEALPKPEPVNAEEEADF